MSAACQKQTLQERSATLRLEVSRSVLRSVRDEPWNGRRVQSGLPLDVTSTIPSASMRRRADCSCVWLSALYVFIDAREMRSSPTCLYRVHRVHRVLDTAYMYEVRR